MTNKMAAERNGLRRLSECSVILFVLLGSGITAANAESARHIAFGPRQTTLVISDSLDRRHSSRDYLLHGRHGQRLKVSLRDLTSGGVVSMYHITFPSGKTFGQKGYDPFDGRLTETGNYKITVSVNNMASNGPSGRFRLTLRR